ncbi:Mtc1 protein [Saccharomycopsis crataegensis]|uniref:Mtc1 protein n=1 Tax=Saccharomycopsis crataegensis TaxID=43959 RepID=A0AAV5QLV5_9ASCO|nr:Mtc1 protein [Saccharomycopsis crataegensis]
MSKEAEEEVLDFLDSLPQDQKPTAESPGDNADILNFLDELAQESNAANLKPAKNAKDDTKDSSPAPTAAKDSQVIPEPESKVLQADAGQEEDYNHESSIPDPISSISGWWGNSGQKHLNSIWGSASHVVGDISKTAQETVSDISKVANDQLKDLSLLDPQDYEKLPEMLKAGRESIINTTNKSIGDQSETINKVGGLFSSFVTSINEQIISTTKTMNHHDETLKIFIINDALKNFNYIDYLIYNKFSKVIGQVEGSIDLEIINSKNFSKLLNILDLAKLTNGDLDLKPKTIDFFKGSSLDAEKLAFANIDEGIKSLMQVKKKEKEEQQAKADQEENNDTNSTRVSHIFLTILPIIQDKSAQTYTSSFEEIVKIDESTTDSFQFLITVKDLEHKFSIVTKSQSFPTKWAQWLTTNSVESQKEAGDDGVEPADWVREWVKDGLALSLGVLAQSYVTKRMGF